jgi:MFS family permease
MKKWGALITLSLAMFIIVIDTTIMNVSISVLVVDLNTTVSGIQGAISIYALVMASLMLIGSRLADIVGPKRIFLIGLIIYSVGTTIASFSGSLGMMVFGWSFLEGVGAALMIPTLQILLRSQYKGADLATSYGVASAVGAVGAAVGPIVGGFFTTYVSWRWAFRSELAIAVVVLLLSSTLVADRLPDKRPRFDYVGALLSIVGWSSIVLGILLAQSYGFFLARQPFVLGPLEIAPFGLSISPVMVGFGVLMIMLLLHWENNLEEAGKDGLFHPSTLETPGLLPGIAVRFTHMMVIAAFLYIVPLLLQLSFSFTAMQTGLALMPFSLSLLVMAIVGARLSSRFFASRIIMVGFVIGLIGLLGVNASITPDATPQDLALGAVFGLGMGLIASQILNLILSSVPPQSTAETAGLNSTFEQLGNAIGVALVGSVMLGVLSMALVRGIDASAVIPVEAKAPLSAAVEQGIQLVSNETITEGLATANVDEAVSTELFDLYGIARTDAFKAGLALLAFFSLVALVLTLRLPKRKLVESEPAPAETG